jgi:hypothetical protein
MLMPGLGYASLAWQVVPSPNVNAGTSLLYAVAARSTTDAWAVGVGARQVNSWGTLVEHWNGTSWSIISSPSPGYSNQLVGVAALASTDAWAVGSTKATSTASNKGLAIHWNGRNWSLATLPDPCAYDTYLNAVAGSSSNDVWAVGSCDSVVSQPAVIEHWNGTAWSATTLPQIGQQAFLTGVVALSSSNAWAVGYYDADGNNFPTLIMHWDGTAWSRVDSPNSGGSVNQLYSVTARNGSDIWAVGTSLVPGTPSTYQTLTEHWDGQAWSVVPSPNVGTENNSAKSVAVSGTSDVWAVGYYVQTTEVCDDTCYDLITNQALTLHWNGSQWLVLDSTNIGTGLSAISAASSTQFWSVGSINSRTLTARLTTQ